MLHPRESWIQLLIPEGTQGNQVGHHRNQVGHLQASLACHASEGMLTCNGDVADPEILKKNGGLLAQLRVHNRAFQGQACREG